MSGFDINLKSINPLFLDADFKFKIFVDRVSLKEILVSISYLKLMV